MIQTMPIKYMLQKLKNKQITQKKIIFKINNHNHDKTLISSNFSCESSVDKLKPQMVDERVWNLRMFCLPIVKSIYLLCPNSI